MSIHQRIVKSAQTLRQQKRFPVSVSAAGKRRNITRQSAFVKEVSICTLSDNRNAITMSSVLILFARSQIRKFRSIVKSRVNATVAILRKDAVLPESQRNPDNESGKRRSWLSYECEFPPWIFHGGFSASVSESRYVPRDAGIINQMYNNISQRIAESNASILEA